MTDTAAIETSALSKTYRGGVQALVGLDLRVERGELFGFLGPNGAGKSTTIRLLLDLIRPTAGRATVLGARRFSRRTRWTRSSTSPTASASSVRAAHPRRLRCVSARARAPSRQITFGAPADPGPFAAIAGARVQQVDGTAPLRVELLVGRQVAAVERHLVWHLVVVAFAAALALAAAARLIERRSEIETP